MAGRRAPLQSSSRLFPRHDVFERGGALMTRLIQWLSLLLATCLAGCGSTHSSLNMEGGTQPRLFVITEEQAFQVAYGAITQVFPGYEITEVDGPVRGYSTTFRFVLDTYTQQVVVVPARGKAADGNWVNGFYFDVSGRGSSVVQGRVKNAELFDTVLKEAQATGRAVPVSELHRSPYVGVKWKQGAPAASLPRNEGEVAARLQQLKDLRDKGLITEEEHTKKRKELVDRL